MEFKNTITGETWDLEELKIAYIQFKEESDYMKIFETFEDYLEDQITKGDLEEINAE